MRFGKPIAVLPALSATSEEHVEESLQTVSRARAQSEEHVEESPQTVSRARAQAVVAAIQQASRRSGTDSLSLDEINAEIQAVRRSRAR